MVVYLKKKVYLTKYYTRLVRENEIVVFFHVSNLLVLKTLRGKKLSIGIQLF